jgi:pimeloyl-ACP methyl ester carboxylesterase
VQSRIAHLATRSVRYLEAGSGGTACVLLHAFPLSADQWLPQLHRVPPGARLVAPDLRGFRGGSVAFETPGLDGVTVDAYAADVLELMTHLEIERAVIAGVSLGGYVAFAVLRRAPARAAGLVLANTRASADSPEARQGRQRTIDFISREGPAGLAREMVPKMLGDTTRREQPDLVEVVQRFIGLNTSEGLIAAVGALRDRPDSTPLLPSIKCPTTIVSGGEDGLIPATDIDAMHRGIPSARLVALPRVGHLSNLEDAAAFSRLLADHLAAG